MNASIYFLTDFHFEIGHEVCEDVIDEIASFLKTDTNETKIIIAGGDLSHSGKSSELSSFENLLRKLKDKSQVDFEFVCCPGNHDVHYLDKETFEPTDIVKYKTKEEHFNAINKRLDKLIAYRTFQENYTNLEKVDSLLYKTKIRCGDKNIVIYSLNNVLFTFYGENYKSSNTKGYVSLPLSTIKAVQRETNDDIVVLAMHYPYTFFDEETERSIRNNWLANVNIVCNGHYHNLNEKTISSYGETVNIIQGKAFYEDWAREECSFIKINLSNNTTEEFHWLPQEHCFVNNGEKNEIVVNFCNKNKFGLMFDQTYLKEITSCELIENNFNLKEIFVFPLLEEKKYSDLDNNDSSVIKSFDIFQQKLEANKYIFIHGEEKSGKTALANFLQLNLFEKHYVPIFCEGMDIEKASIEKIIKNKIGDMYQHPNVAETKFDNSVDKNSKVLIIDNAYSLEKTKLEELSLYFGKIIVFANPKIDGDFKDKVFINDKEVLHYVIQPMIKSKRKEYCENIYSCLKNKGEKAQLSKEKFSEYVERILMNFDQQEMYDPISLAFLIIYAYRNNASFDNKFFSSIYQARTLLLLEQNNQKTQPVYNIDVVQRIISSIAYDMYNKSVERISADNINNYIDLDERKYGSFGIKQQKLLSLMVESHICKQNDDGTITFASRDVFSYYIAKNIALNKRKKEIKLLRKTIESSLFKPLNFGIIMCLSSIISEEDTATIIINSIEKKFKKQKTLNEKYFSLDGLTNDQKEKLKKLSEADIKKIKEHEDEKETKQRKHYLKNKDSLYYEEIIDSNIKDIVEWYDRLKVCCVLLKKFSSKITMGPRQKLVRLIVNIPNVIIYKFNKYFFKTLDKAYSELCSSGISDINLLDKINSLIISCKRAFVLSTYDFGSRSFTENANISLLKDEIDKASSSPLKIAQSLMFSSFSSNEKDFLKQCKDIIESDKYSDNSFQKMSARLIGRRFLIENSNETKVTNKYDSFEHLIYGTNADAKKNDKIEKFKKINFKK